MNNEEAEQHGGSHAENNAAPRLQIEIQDLDLQSPHQTQGNGTMQQQPGVDLEAPPAMPSQNRTEEADIETGFIIATSVTLTMAAGIISVLAGFLGNQTTSATHELFFKASMMSMCTIVIFRCFILLLAIFRPSIPCLSAIVKILVLAAIGSLASVVGFGVTFILPKRQIGAWMARLLGVQVCRRFSIVSFF